MKAIEINIATSFGFDRKFTITPNRSGDEWFLAEIDPDFGMETFMGVYGSIDAAMGRIEDITR